uniref:Uncharacterized protein n=1 Tax=Candidatus Enterococcus clewellii TaxID=1834193 RepID=A0A242K295_9ENTE|nr:VOC family protein [Enterococcus sp. 9E7_DIV0242]OTP12712.1 hypothetical protein A5888_003291 [Enterococcus sp. 9E7_DIV0242]
MLGFKLADNASLKTISFRIKDNENMVGLTLKSEENGLSIFSANKEKTQALILEEGETFSHAAVHFSVCLPSEVEWLDLVRRFNEHGYPIQRKKTEEGTEKIIVVDPEENEIEFYYQENQLDSPEKAVVDDLQEAEALQKDDGNVFRISLNTLDVQSSKEFYEKVLGLASMDDTTLRLGDQDVVFQLLEKEHLGQRADLGWNFFVVDLDGTEEIEKLMYHLEQKKQDFFIDNKRSILTVFDINGIEWWFTKNRV